MSRSLTKSSWMAMHNRCKYPSQVGFDRYGGAGVRVCERWSNFDAFLEDMGPRPSRAHSIDRIDSRGDYTPTNCRWVTADVQNRNRKDNVMITVGGVTLCAEDWGKRTGVDAELIRTRKQHGWSDERAIQPPRRAPVITHDGITLTLYGWSQRMGVPSYLLYNRLRGGWSVERALTTPARAGRRATR